MQVNVAGLRRNIKNLAHNYSDAQVKVREATSNDPWGPSAAIMAEIADLTYNVVAFSEIMQMIWKRLNDHGKNWRHVYKALILLEYLIKTGTEKVAQQCKENIFAIQTLREFVYYEEGKDQGTHVREKAKQLVTLLKDDERLKNERFKALKAKERFAQHPSGFGSDGYIDGPSQRDMPPGWQEDPKPMSDLELVRPQTAGEEELQLKLAMAMSREEAEQEEAKRRSDDVRLQLALSQSEQDFNVNRDQQTVRPPKREEQQSHLLDLLDISLGAASISSPPLGATGGLGGPDPWVSGQARAASQLSDPWSGTSSPQIDPWQPSAMALRSNTSSVPLGAGAGAGAVGGLSGAAGTNGEAWALRTQSPSIASGSSTEGWLQSNGGGAGAAAVVAPGMNGNTSGNAVGDPWLGKSTASSLAAAQPLTNQATGGNTNADPWLGGAPRTAVPVAAEKPLALEDPWAPKALPGTADDPWKNLEHTGAIKKTSPDLDEFDIISNRKKTAGDLLTDDLLSGPNNNITTTEIATTNGKKPLKTPQAFLGENSSLVNLDNLIKPIIPQAQPGSAAYNPFSDTVIPPKTNLFQQQQPAVPSINQLKQQQPFAMAAVNADPWAPISNAGNVSQQVQENPFVHELNGQLTKTSSRPTLNDRYSALSEPITTTSVFDLNTNKNEIDYLYFYCNNNNNNNNNQSYSKHNSPQLYPSDSDDDIFNTAYVPYHFLSSNSHSKQSNIVADHHQVPQPQPRPQQNPNRFYASNLGSITTTGGIDAWNMPIIRANDNSNHGLCVDDVYALKSMASSSASSRFSQRDVYANSPHGGSLFNYGFYDSNTNNATNLQRGVSQRNFRNSTTTAYSLGCNNNNNNMAWIKPEAASSNPFLS